MRKFDTIAKLLRDRRMTHTKRYSQQELSALLGYKNGQFISNVERGLCSIPVKALRDISNILGIPASELKAALIEDYKSNLENYLG